MLRIALAALLGVYAACGNPTAASSSLTPLPTESSREELELGGLGASCGEGDLCVTGTCVRYHGIAGASGPSLASCEIACAHPGATCPTGATCITIADGPGAVCRPDGARPGARRPPGRPRSAAHADQRSA